MKALILMLLIASSVEAQSLADEARMERERKAATRNVHVFTTEDAKNSAPTAVISVDSNAPKPDAGTAAAKAATPPAAKPAEDPRQKYTEDLAKLKAKVVELQDQETAIELQLNDLKNAFLAPVTDQATQADAQAKLGPAQAELLETQKDLADAKKAAEELEAQGPPPKP